jgi:hypothetical protein
MLTVREVWYRPLYAPDSQQYLRMLQAWMFMKAVLGNLITEEFERISLLDSRYVSIQIAVIRLRSFRNHCNSRFLKDSRDA